MAEAVLNLAARNDEVGSLVSQSRRLNLISEVLVGALDDQASDWWRNLADEQHNQEAADRLRQVAALIEEANL